MKRFEIIQLILFLVIFGSCLSPIIFWVMNPELTAMQVAGKFWWVFIVVLLSGSYAFWLEDKNQPTF
jgi:hypothetical protein